MLHAFYDKYCEPSGLLNYETLYKRVSLNAVRRQHGETKSHAAQRKEYVDKLGRNRYVANGRPFTGGPRTKSELLRSVLYR